jgi:phosphatidylglycerophosphatase A
MTIFMNKHNYSLKNPIHFLALGLGSGLLKPAPGTWGTLAAMPFCWLLMQLPLLFAVSIIALAFILGIYICGKTADDMGCHDHGSIVWDEFVGLWISALLIPKESWTWLLAAFLVFRFFDIVKPFPIGLLDKKVSGGFGIMLDDVVAGLYAVAFLWISEQFVTSMFT